MVQKLAARRDLRCLRAVINLLLLLVVLVATLTLMAKASRGGPDGPRADPDVTSTSVDGACIDRSMVYYPRN